MMGKRNCLVLGLLLLLASGCSVAPTDDSVNTQVVRMELNESSTLELGFGNSQWLYPLEQATEALVSEPQYKSDSPVYYSAAYGDSKDNTFAFVIDESGGTGSGYDTVYVDADNDNHIDSAEERFEFRVGTTSRADPVRVRILVTSGGKTSSYWADFSAFLYSDEKHPDERIHANLRNSSYYTGKALIAGKMHSVAIADLNSNGLFNDTGMGSFEGDRFFVDLNNDGSFRDDRGEGQSAGFRYARYTQIDGKWYSIVASPDGGRIEISAATPKLGEVRAPPMVAWASLRSETQPCRLTFTNGSARGIAGTYTVPSIALERRDENRRLWRTTARFPDDAHPEITIRQNDVVQLGVGRLPLRIEPKTSRTDDSGVLDLELQITGAAGQIYRWSQGNPGAVKPGIEVRDESGYALVFAAFRYG